MHRSALRLLAIAVGLALALAACGGDDDGDQAATDTTSTTEATRTTEGDAATTTSAPTTTTTAPVDPFAPTVEANALQVGDCVVQDLSGDVVSVATIPCTTSHRYEVYARFDLEGGQFPGDDEVTRQANEGCAGDLFEDYVGLPYSESEIYSTTLVPSAATWDQADDRTVICLAVTQNLSSSTGSVRGADR